MTKKHMDQSWEHKLYTAICAAQQKHSQGQKLNMILEDILVLFDLFFQKKDQPFDKQTLWSCCFEFPTTFEAHRIKYALIYDILKNKTNEPFFAILITALQDPPKEWWNNKYELLLRRT